MSEQPQAVELLRVEDALEELEEVVRRDELPLRDVAEILPGREEDGRRELGQEMVGQIEIEIEAREIAPGLTQDFLDVKVRKQHAAFGLLRMRERHEAARENVPLADVFGREAREVFPGEPVLKTHANAPLNGFAARHRDRAGVVAKIVTRLEERELALHRRRLFLDLGRHQCLEVDVLVASSVHVAAAAGGGGLFGGGSTKSSAGDSAAVGCDVRPRRSGRDRRCTRQRMQKKRMKWCDSLVVVLGGSVAMHRPCPGTRNVELPVCVVGRALGVSAPH